MIYREGHRGARFHNTARWARSHSTVGNLKVTTVAEYGFLLWRPRIPAAPRLYFTVAAADTSHITTGIPDYGYFAVCNIFFCDSTSNPLPRDLAWVGYKEYNLLTHADGGPPYFRSAAYGRGTTPSAVGTGAAVRALRRGGAPCHRSSALNARAHSSTPPPRGPDAARQRAR